MIEDLHFNIQVYYFTWAKDMISFFKVHFLKHCFDILGNMLVCFLAKSSKRGSTPLVSLYSQHEAVPSSWLARFIIKETISVIYKLKCKSNKLWCHLTSCSKLTQPRFREDTAPGQKIVQHMTAPKPEACVLHPLED